MTAAAFRATLRSFRTTGKELVISFAVPIEKAPEALAIVGIPSDETSTWFAIALLKQDTAKAAGKATGTGRQVVVEDSPDASVQAAAPAETASATKPAVDSPASHKERLDWAALSPTKQAGMRCNDVRFQRWLGATDSEGAAELVRARCGCRRRDFPLDHGATVIWQKIDADFRAHLETEGREPFL